MKVRSVFSFDKKDIDILQIRIKSLNVLKEKEKSKIYHVKGPRRGTNARKCHKSDSIYVSAVLHQIQLCWLLAVCRCSVFRTDLRNDLRAGLVFLRFGVLPSAAAAAAFFVFFFLALTFLGGWYTVGCSSITSSPVLPVVSRRLGMGGGILSARVGRVGELLLVLRLWLLLILDGLLAGTCSERLLDVFSELLGIIGEPLTNTCGGVLLGTMGGMLTGIIGEL